MEASEFALHAQIEDRHWWFMARREIILDFMEKYIPAGEGRLVAEIGCGTGGNLAFLKGHYRVIGVDTSPDAVRYASEKLQCPVLLGDFREKLAGRWEELDGVLLADVLEHVEDDASFVEDIVASLKPGGMLFITVPAHRFLWSHHDLVLGHLRRYSAGELRSLWKGLTVSEQFFSPFNTVLFPVIAALRALLPSKKSTGVSDLRLPPSLINRLLYKLFSAERILLKHFRLPFGVSYMAVLEKTRDEACKSPARNIR